MTDTGILAALERVTAAMEPWGEADGVAGLNAQGVRDDLAILRELREKVSACYGAEYTEDWSDRVCELMDFLRIKDPG